MMNLLSKGLIICVLVVTSFSQHFFTFRSQYDGYVYPKWKFKELIGSYFYEDAVVVGKDFIVLADGLGGPEGLSGIYSIFQCLKIAQTISVLKPKSREELSKEVEKASKEASSLLKVDKIKSLMSKVATTMVYLKLEGDQLFTGVIGDSGFIVLRYDSVTDTMKLKHQSSESVHDFNAPYNINPYRVDEAEISQIDVMTGDVVIALSDGVIDVLSTSFIVAATNYLVRRMIGKVRKSENLDSFDYDYDLGDFVEAYVQNLHKVSQNLQYTIKNTLKDINDHKVVIHPEEVLEIPSNIQQGGGNPSQQQMKGQSDLSQQEQQQMQKLKEYLQMKEQQQELLKQDLQQQFQKSSENLGNADLSDEEDDVIDDEEKPEFNFKNLDRATINDIANEDIPELEIPVFNFENPDYVYNEGKPELRIPQLDASLKRSKAVQNPNQMPILNQPNIIANLQIEPRQSDNRLSQSQKVYQDQLHKQKLKEEEKIKEELYKKKLAQLNYQKIFEKRIDKAMREIYRYEICNVFDPTQHGLIFKENNNIPRLNFLTYHNLEHLKIKNLPAVDCFRNKNIIKKTSHHLNPTEWKCEHILDLNTPVHPIKNSQRRFQFHNFHKCVINAIPKLPKDTTPEEIAKVFNSRYVSRNLSLAAKYVSNDPRIILDVFLLKSFFDDKRYEVIFPQKARDYEDIDWTTKSDDISVASTAISTEDIFNKAKADPERIFYKDLGTHANEIEKWFEEMNKLIPEKNII